MHPLITRKEIAQLTGLSPRTVRRREADWGLAALKVQAAGCHPVFYQRSLSIFVLTRLKLLECPPQATLGQHGTPWAVAHHD